ncbi:unnamed protein product, partial [Iphiclides podalirius]
MCLAIVVGRGKTSLDRSATLPRRSRHRAASRSGAAPSTLRVRPLGRGTHVRETRARPLEERHGIGMTQSLDVQLFICQVAKHPEIWDLNSEGNRHRRSKQRAWAQIARVFMADFDSMPDREKREVYKKLHGKWRNIRDSYVRDLRRKEGRRGYIYEEQLAFLQDLYSSSKGSGSEDPREHGEAAHRKRSAGKRHELSGASALASAEPPVIDNPRRRKRVNKADKIDFVDTPCHDHGRSYPVEDEDRSFFESLLPAVREFDVDRKLEFRSEVIRLVKQLRNCEGKTKADPS